MASSTVSSPARRVSDLQRSAFWIYGVTAMVMREPFGLIARHVSEAGLGNSQVRLEILRVVVILIVLSRLFLASGLYFETVYMQPGAAELFPRRSYPIDFLAGLKQFLVATAATTTIVLHVRWGGGLAPFTFLVVAFLCVEPAWLALAALRRFSSVPLIRRDALRNAAILAAVALSGAVANLIGLDPGRADLVVLVVIGTLGIADIVRQIRTYEALDA